jgi:ribonuclease HI
MWGIMVSMTPKNHHPQNHIQNQSKRIAYTDGAASGNPGPAGWGVVLLDGNETIVFETGGSEKIATNNQMELMGVIMALRLVYKEATSGVEILDLEIRTDSQYCIKGATEWLQGWKAKAWMGSAGPVKNRDLWEKVDLGLSHFVQLGVPVRFTYVKGHSGEKWNDRADAIAVENSRSVGR